MFGFSIRTGRQNASGSPRSTGSPMTAGAGSASPTSVGSPRMTGTPKSIGSPRTEVVGEIDTRAPFQSVRAAVTLFGEAGTSPMAKPSMKKSKTFEERVLEKESQLHLALRELDSFRQQIRSTETTKAHALRELEKAKRTLQELTCKLETLCESKQAAIEATEDAKSRARELEEQKSNKPQVGNDAWKQNVDAEREQYRASSGELNSAKQELTNLRQDVDAALEAKLAAFQEAADAQHNVAINRERLGKLSKEVTNLRETLGQVKLASLQAQDEHEKLIADKEAHLQSLRTAKEEADGNIRVLKQDYESQLMNEKVVEKLEETNEAIEVLQEQLNNVRASDLDALTKAGSELDVAKNALKELDEEESSLRSLVDSLQREVDCVKAYQYELKKKADEAESIAESLQVDLDNSKKELEATISGKSKTDGDASDDLQSQIQQLTSEAIQFLQEAEEMKKNTELLRQETKTAQVATKETEERLEIALKEAEEAKAAERLADDQIHNSSRTHDAADDTRPESNGMIKLTVEEFEALSRKVENIRTEADIKVATAMAQVETINANEKEALKKLEAILKEKEDIEAAMEEALKAAEMAEGAKQVVEGELQKWRHKEHDIEVGESSSGMERTEL